jgi:hypothetical protein
MIFSMYVPQPPLMPKVGNVAAKRYNEDKIDDNI